MAETSNIAWTRSTFNPWIGCTKVGPGCDHCYAEALDKRYRWGGDTHWGDDKPRHRTSVANWRAPITWDRQAAAEREYGELHKASSTWHTPGFWPVFCASLADVFDNQVPASWRQDLWNVVMDTPNLSWLLVTKRIGNVAKMVPLHWMHKNFPPNVRLLITVINQEEADRDVPKLLALPCRNGVSYEPALGSVDWSRFLGPQCVNGSVPGPYPNSGVMCERCQGSRVNSGCPGLEWIIVGGESDQGGSKARPFNANWAYSTIEQCKAAGVPVFVKQMGSHAVSRDFGDMHLFKDRAGADPAEWNERLRVQEFPA